MHSELCTCCHNIEDGQKGKQDAQIIFWKFPKASISTGKRYVKKEFLDITALIRSTQCAESELACFRMGQVDCDQNDCAGGSTV